MKQKSWLPIALAALVGALGGALGLHWHEQRGCHGLAFVNQALACDSRSEDRSRYASLENDVRKRLTARQAKGELSRASVYFLALESGATFGIQEDTKFAPASLLKLPLAFVYLVLEAEQPGLLNKKLPYAAVQVRDYQIPAQNELSPAGLAPGAPTTIEALLRAAVAHSDNLAYYILLQYLKDQPQGAERFQRTLQEIGIVDPEKLTDETVSVHNYASLFRLLYNASYLDVDASERLLSWLGEAAYDKGLAAGVPRGVVVANKFGERSLDDGSRQLHDCGIVYHESDPYVLCVMTKGRDFGDLEATIAEVSERVYAAMAAR